LSLSALEFGDAVKRGLDVILALIAAMATALLLALIARDDIEMPYKIREDALIAASSW
jgi:hypothetical protein